MVVKYVSTLDGLAPEDLEGFGVGWSAPLPGTVIAAVLRGSQAFELAIRDEGPRVVGFVNAVGDGVLTAYLPLLEVRPEFQGQGIGSELVRRMLARLQGTYMVDLLCDAELAHWYSRFGMQRVTGMCHRDFEALASLSRPS